MPVRSLNVYVRPSELTVGRSEARTGTISLMVPGFSPTRPSTTWLATNLELASLTRAGSA